jgi:MoxR-like ATPase
MLPEAQLDRFMVCLRLGYPEMADEMEILKGKHNQEEVRAVISREKLQQIQGEVEWIQVKDAVYQYAGDLVSRTRSHPMVDLGISPRGTINIIQMAKSMAYLRQRAYVVPEDVQDVFLPVCSHRLMLNVKARMAQMDAGQILQEILKSVPVPKAL